MYKSILHSLVAVFAAAVLLLQHAPLVHTGHGFDEHCVHCTANYCTKENCSCGHNHKANPHRGHAADAAPASGHGAHHSGHSEHHSLQHSNAGDQNGRYAAMRTTIKPCGGPSSGIISLSLDKFVAGITATVSPLEVDRPSSSRYVGLSDQLVTRSIFHPPVLG